MFPEAEMWVDVAPCSDHTPPTLVLTGGKLGRTWESWFSL
jgi:hypothetical protein